MRILVLMGGDSPEREVSLRSGKAIFDAVKSLGHETYSYDPIDGFAGLDTFADKIDIVLPILHGLHGEDGVVQEELEARAFKYLGTDAAASKTCFDKQKTKAIIAELGFKTPASEIVDAEKFSISPIRNSGKYVLKPIAGGSTIDAFIVNDPKDHVNKKVFEKYPEMLLEELIEGVEITVPVLDNKALPVIEIIPPAGKDFDYENKYNGLTQELCPPKHLDLPSQEKAQSIAQKLHSQTKARHLSRTDIIVDDAGEHWVLEINTMPGMTDQSLYPKSALVAGMSFEQLVEKFIEMAAA
jgi:D-alanine-D-alanine ligase